MECVDQESHLFSLEGDCSKTNSIFDLDDSEYVLLEEYERGMHRGQDSDPQLIGNLLTIAGFERWIFNLDSVGQFDAQFSVWLHKEEAEREDGMGLIEAKRALERGKTDGPSVSEAMERGLKQASRQEAELRAQGATGLISSSITPDGATTREVSEEDFLAGKALDS